LKQYIPILTVVLFLIFIGDVQAQVPVMRGWSASPKSESVFQKKADPKDKVKTRQGSFGSSMGRSGSSTGTRSLSKRGTGIGATADDPCPKSQRLAKKQAKGDAAAFAKKNPSGTWALFMYKFRQQYSTCSPFIKRAYVEAAREVLQPKKRVMFAR
jgi:hypothetical protein